MKGDRLLVPVEHDYALALGRALFIFAKLEWSAVNCCERIELNSIHALPPMKKTARGIARKLIYLAATLHPSAVQSELFAAAARFDKLAQRRNDIFHAQPASTTEGAQRLYRDGAFLEIEAIDEAADCFKECNERLVALWDKLPRGAIAAP